MTTGGGSRRRRRVLALMAMVVAGVPLLGTGPAGAAAPTPGARNVQQFACPAGQVPDAGFTDVGGNTFEIEIECLAWWGITQGGPAGLPDDQYGPGIDVRRDQMATFITRMIDKVDPAALPAYDGTSDFTDVGSGNAHVAAINRLAAAGIVTGGPAGIPANAYGPEMLVNRGQMASFINRAHELLTGQLLTSTTSYFDDDAAPHEANIDGLAAAGVVQGRSLGVYAPGDPVRRDAMAAFLMRTADLAVANGHTEPPSAGMSVILVKSADADGDGIFHPSETASAADAPVPFRLTVVNNGAVPAFIENLTDEYPGQQPFSPCFGLLGTTVQPGGFASCTFTEPSYAPPDNASLVNTARVNASEPGTPTNADSDTDTATVTTSTGPPPGPAVSVAKTADANADGNFAESERAPAVGATVTFRVNIVNTGTVRARITSITDEWAGQAPFAVCPNLSGHEMGPGGSASCTFTQSGYAPPNGTSRVNTARVAVAAADGSGGTATGSDVATVTSGQLAGLAMTVDKTNDADDDGSYNETEEATPGSTVSFKAVVVNTGTATARITSLTDEWPGQAPFAICTSLVGTAIPSGGSAACTFSRSGYAPTPNSSVVNTVRVGFVDVDDDDTTASASDTSTVTTGDDEPGDLALLVAKTNDANGNGTYTDVEAAATAGAAVPFRVALTNTSDVAVRITSVTDEWAGQTAFDVCAALVGQTLQPDGTASCNFTQTGYAPSTGSSRVNTVRVGVADAADASRTATASDTSTVTGGAQPAVGIDILKTNDANGNGSFNDSEAAAAASASVPFRLVLTNTGASAVTVTSLTDEWPGQAAKNVCAGLVGTTIQPGLSSSCTFTEPGYSPAVGATKVNTARVTVAQSGNNTSTATDSDTSTVTTSGTPGTLLIDVQKTNNANGDATYSDNEQAPAPNSAVPFRALITNSSTVPVVITALTDQWSGQAPFTVCASLVGQTIAAGGTATCNFTQGAYSPAAGTPKVNTVNVSVQQSGNATNTATDSDTATVTSAAGTSTLAIAVAKTNDANGNGAFTDNEQAPVSGSAVPFRVNLTNTSTVPVRITSITDAWTGQAAFNVCADLINVVMQPNGTAVCTFTLQGYAPTAGTSRVNTVTVGIVDNADASRTASGSDTSTVTSATNPTLAVDVQKTNDATNNGTFNDTEQAATAGASVPFRVVITNTGGTALNITSITDEWPGQTAKNVCASLVNTTVQPGLSSSCTFTETGYSPAAGGTKVNTVRVNAVQTSNTANATNDSDTSTVTTATGTPTLAIDVQKTNNANNDGAFNDSEQATTEGNAVTFRAVITNSSAVSVVVTSLTDQWSGQAPFTICGASVVGQTITPGGTRTCEFTQNGYAPPVGDNKLNTVSVTVQESGNAANTVTDTDTSTVTSASNAPVNLAVVKTNNANGDATFSDNETAASANATVPFRMVVTNNSLVAVTITSITDQWPGQGPFIVCGDLAGDTLQPGGVAQCDFSLAGYSPASGQSRVNTITVNATSNSTTNSASVPDTSTVNTA